MANASETSAREDWPDRYAAERNKFENFARRLRDLVADLLRNGAIDFAQVEYRAKDVSSFADKLTRKPGRYVNPLTDMTDLAGLRVIVYYTSDVDRAGDLLEREFEIDGENSVRKSRELDPDQFGYLSDHYVLSLDDDRGSLAEWRRYKDLKAEVQVRTAVQHAWAAIDHKLNYKREGDVPDEIKRQLSRVSALLEVADSEFEAVRKAAEQLQADYRRRLQEGHLDLPVNAESLATYLAESDITRRLHDAADAVGYRTDEHSGNTGELAHACEISGVTTLADLDALLRAGPPSTRAVLEAVFNAHAEDVDSVWIEGSSEHYAATLVFVRSEVDIGLVEELTDYSDTYYEGLRRAQNAAGST